METLSNLHELQLPEEIDFTRISTGLLREVETLASAQASTDVKSKTNEQPSKALLSQSSLRFAVRTRSFDDRMYRPSASSREGASEEAGDQRLSRAKTIATPRRRNERAAYQSRRKIDIQFIEDEAPLRRLAATRTSKRHLYTCPVCKCRIRSSSTIKVHCRRCRYVSFGRGVKAATVCGLLVSSSLLGLLMLFVLVITSELALSPVWLTSTRAAIGLLLLCVAAHMFAIVIALKRKSCQHVGPIADNGNESHERQSNPNNAPPAIVLSEFHL